MSKASNRSLFFYQGDKLITVKQGDQHRAIFRNADTPLAELQAGNTPGGGLLATDDKGSVLMVQGDEEEEHNYSVYGHDPTHPSRHTALGFNGERVEPSLKVFQLGNGYRSYSPNLMRFHSTDSLSPFNDGGLNTYAYCANDPVNAVDPTGHLKVVIERFTQIKRSPATTVTKVTAGTELPRSARIVQQGNSRYYSKIWQPETIYRYETKTLHMKQLSPELGGGIGAVPSDRLSQYSDNRKELKQLQAIQNSTLSEADAGRIFALENKQRAILSQGAKLLNQAMDPQDLTTYIRGVPRSTS